MAQARPRRTAQSLCRETRYLQVLHSSSDVLPVKPETPTQVCQAWARIRLYSRGFGEGTQQASHRGCGHGNKVICSYL